MIKQRDHIIALSVPIVWYPSPPLGLPEMLTVAYVGLFGPFVISVICTLPLSKMLQGPWRSREHQVLHVISYDPGHFLETLAIRRGQTALE